MTIDAQSLDVTQKALPLLAPVEPLTVPDPLLPYLSPISSCDSLSSHSHHQSEVTETQHRPNRTSLPKAEPSAPAHLRLLHWHLQRLLVISIELARRISDDATPYGVGSAFLALEDDAVKVFEEWSQDVVGIFEAIRAVQPVPPPRKLARNHRRRHTMGAETGDESDVARPEASRRKSFVPKRQSSVDPSSTTGCDAMAPPTRGSLSVADVIIQPVQRVARFHLFLRCAALALFC